MERLNHCGQAKNETHACNLCARIDPVSGFTQHTGKLAVYDADNVDTDRIIPARFLSMVSRSGYGKLLFKDVRGEDFPLDQPDAEGASILVVGSNFGCGSSREHAVWAIQQAGFKAVIGRKTAEAPGFSDIFRQNSANCGLPLIELPAESHSMLVQAGSGSEVTIDLAAQTIALAGEKLPFDIAASLKEAMIEGLDLIGTTLRLEDAIAKHEAGSTVYVPKVPARAR
jgi:3-isopropylmalate/(R)-2-methylmalate dehydratase small subunit